MLDARIRLLAVSIADDLAELKVLLERAKAMDAHVALGYASFGAYVAAVLPVKDIRLSARVRGELVRYLRDHKLTQQQIADAVGAGLGTVNRDLHASDFPTGKSRAALSAIAGRGRGARHTNCLEAIAGRAAALLGDTVKLREAWTAGGRTGCTPYEKEQIACLADQLRQVQQLLAEIDCGTAPS